jgi:thiamine biosynthesis protein ThiS
MEVAWVNEGRLPDASQVVKVRRSVYRLLVRVTVNGEPRELAGPTTVADLVMLLGLNLRRIAVEVNCDVVSRDDYGAHQLGEGDAVEIVHFIGGG